jgi:hypothetical protein
MGLTREAWLAVYNYCTNDDYSFMYLNFFFPKGKRIMKNFDEVINVSMDETE